MAPKGLKMSKSRKEYVQKDLIFYEPYGWTFLVLHDQNYNVLCILFDVTIKHIQFVIPKNTKVKKQNTNKNFILTNLDWIILCSNSLHFNRFKKTKISCEFLWLCMFLLNTVVGWCIYVKLLDFGSKEICIMCYGNGIGTFKPKITIFNLLIWSWYV